ncbi:hypothetical protein C8J57DRAFT_1523642 [Mycena rebaudengoi]|nr:hypothetical protein C8J57DRAFT_1523642 [Mycena rebaudengoi]
MFPNGMMARGPDKMNGALNLVPNQYTRIPKYGAADAAQPATCPNYNLDRRKIHPRPTLVEAIAVRGAHITALTRSVVAWIDLLTTTSNENIYADQGSRGGAGNDKDEQEREQGALATFLLTKTLLLRSLLTAPLESDIRIVNVVSRFYAAASPAPFSSFSLSNPLNNPKSTLPPPRSSSAKARTLPRHSSASSTRFPRTAVSVSPGICHVDKIAPLLVVVQRVHAGYIGVSLFVFFPLELCFRGRTITSVRIRFDFSFPAHSM